MLNVPNTATINTSNVTNLNAESITSQLLNIPNTATINNLNTTTTNTITTNVTNLNVTNTATIDNLNATTAVITTTNTAALNVTTINANGEYTSTGQSVGYKSAPLGDNSSQLITSGVYTVLHSIWSGPSLIQGGISYNNGIFTIAKAGFYSISLHVSFVKSGNYRFFAYVFLNDATFNTSNAWSNKVLSDTSSQNLLAVNAFIFLNTGDTLRSCVFHTSNTSLYVNATIGKCDFSVVRLF
jgi:hypothetical protein